MKKELSVLLAGFFLATICCSGINSPLAGTWVGIDKHDNRTDSYTFIIKEKRGGVYEGFIESKIDGALLPRMKINRIEYNHPDFRFIINSGDLVITYLGKMSDDYNQLNGHFEYSNPHIPDKELPLLRQSATNLSIPEYHYKKPTSNSLTAASANEVGLKESAIEKLINHTLSGEFGEINSILIVKDGKLVAEEYFHGFTGNEPHQLQSITKSITSLLIGIAIDKGLIKSIDEKVISFFKNIEYAEGWENVSIRNLLTMSSGVQWIKEDPDSPWDKDEKISSMLLKPVVKETGTEFSYNSVMQVLAGVLENAAGMKPEKFAEHYLFHPLGITNFQWQYSQVDSLPLCTGSLKMLPVDMAKIGVLISNRGKFENNQIISENWIIESTRAQIEVPENKGHNYGYLWWIKTKSPQFIYAHGFGGQFIFIVPESDIVMITTGNNMFNNKDVAPFKMLTDYVLK